MSTLRKCQDETKRDNDTHILTMAFRLMGPFPLGKKQLGLLIVAVDYFTKWVEVEPMTAITKAKVISFVWKNIICRFGVPYVIISESSINV